MGEIIKVYRINDKFKVELPDLKIYMLSTKSLKWNLRRTFGLPFWYIDSIMIALEVAGVAQFEYRKVA